MTVEGFYTLQLTCDRAGCKGVRVEVDDEEDVGITMSGEREIVVSEDRQSALIRARSNGWLISVNSTVCPQCAKRRKPDALKTPLTAPRRGNGLQKR